MQGLRSSTVETNDLARAYQHDSEKNSRPMKPIPTLPPFTWRWKARRGTCNRSCGTKSTGLRAKRCAMPSGTQQARRIEVEIRYDNGSFACGCGMTERESTRRFSAGDGRAGHYGLHGMRERAKLVGGKLAVWSDSIPVRRSS